VACWVVTVVCGIVVCGIVVCGIVVCGIIGCGIVVCSIVVICGVVVGRVGSAIDREGCIVESGCSGGKGCDCVVVVVIIVVGSIDPGGEGWSGSCGGRRVVTLLSLLLLLPAVRSRGRAVRSALVVMRRWGGGYVAVFEVCLVGLVGRRGVSLLVLVAVAIHRSLPGFGCSRCQELCRIL